MHILPMNFISNFWQYRFAKRQNIAKTNDIMATAIANIEK